MRRADSNLRQLTGYRLQRATSAAMPGINKVLAKFGLRRSTYSSLVVIVANPGLNQGQLADSLSIERSNFVQIVDRLEQADLVSRTKSAEDRRAYVLRATARGIALEAEASEALARFEDRLMRGLSDEDIARLHHSLQIIETNAVETEAHDGCEVQTT